MSNFFSNLKTRIQNILPKKGEKKRVKTPTVLQMEAVECGAACLGIILAHHGYIAPLEELRLACGVSRDGSKASNMLKAARRYGLVAKGFRANPKILKTLEFPLIVHWNFNHFIVVEGFDSEKYYLNDPATGPRTVSEEEFDQSFTGVALTFSKGENFEKGGKKRNLFEILWPRLQGSERALGYVFLVSLALVIPGLLIHTFSRVFVDFVLVRQLDSWLWPLLIGLGLTAVMRMALTWLQQRYLLRMETKLAVVNSGRLFWHMLRLPIEFFTQRSAGEVGSRLDMNDRVAQLLSGQLATALLNIVLLVFYALLMFQYSVVLTLVGIGMVGINLVTLRYISRKRVDINQRLIREQGHMFATAATGLQSIETLKATGAESDFFTRWSGYQAKAINAEQELGVFNQVVTVIPTFLSTATTVAILIIGGFSVMNGLMTIGMLVAFQSLMESFLAPVNQLVDLGGQLQEIEGTLTRLEDVLQYPPDEQVKIVEEPAAETREKLSGAVEIRGLSFGYSRLESPLIDNFNLKLEPGSRVALVGGSGSGKSTIAKLLVGLYQPWEGEFFFDNHRREEIPRSILNASLAFVDQDIFLFEATIKENLTMWDINIPEEDVIQAAKDAYIHNVVAARANGYNALVEEGGRNFSGGQRQRLEIARALVNSPSVLVLDEATSALDPLAEQIIDGNLRRRGCTCIIVAHRLSTIRDCDEIIVLERGKVVERGTHNQLWQARGSYFRLIQAEAPESEMRVERLLEALYE